MESPNNKQAISSSSHFFQLVKNGLKAGGVSLLIIGFILLLLNQVLANLEKDMQSLIGIMLCSLAQAWVAIQGSLGVSFYNRSSGNIASPMDGAQIGAVSGIFLVIIGGISAVVAGQVSWEEFIANLTATIPMVIIPAAFGGFGWALRSNQKKSALKNNGAQNDIAKPVTASQPAIIAPSHKSPIVAGLLSFLLLGGGGQIYLGQWKKGLALIVAAWLTSNYLPFTLLLISIGVSDAYDAAQKLKNGNPVGEWEFTSTRKTFFSAFAIMVLLFIFYLWMTLV